MFRNVFLIIIEAYQIVLSPLLRHLFPGYSCSFEPSCSEYAYEAIRKYGIRRGCFLGFKRIIRCHPWSRGGYDPI